MRKMQVRMSVGRTRRHAVTLGRVTPTVRIRYRQWEIGHRCVLQLEFWRNQS